MVLKCYSFLIIYFSFIVHKFKLKSKCVKIEIYNFLALKITSTEEIATGTSQISVKPEKSGFKCLREMMQLIRVVK